MNRNNKSTWDEYYNYVSQLQTDEVSEELKQEVLSSYSYLRQEFGEKFLSNHAKGHPVAAKIFNRAPWQLEDLVAFTDTLKSFKNSTRDYDVLIKKLRQRDKALTEGIPITEIAQILSPGGFAVKIEPEVDFDKKPDLEIWDPVTDSKLYGELTLLNESDDSKKKTDDFLTLSMAIETTGPYINYACRQLSALPSESDDLILFIRSCKETIAKEKVFKVFENKFIVLALAPEDEIAQLQNWCGEQRLEINHVKTFELEFDETKRIVNNKFKEKVKQIPSNHNGIVFIKVHPLFFWSSGVVNSTISISKSLSQYPNIIGVVIFSFLGHQQVENIIPLGSSFLRQRPVNRLTIRNILFINNDIAALKIDQIVLNKLILAIAG